MAQNVAAGAGPRLWNAQADAHDPISTRTFGFCLYIISDALIFAGLFASYAVLDNPWNAAGGPMAAQVANPLQGFWQTLAVLGSVLAYSLAMVALKKGHRGGLMGGLVAAILLGLLFLTLGSEDLLTLAAQGIVPDHSAYLSVFFTLIITHGLHMVFGLLWMAVMLVQAARGKFTNEVVGRLLNLRMFWQFQATIWVCVYVYVYLMGAYSV